MKTTPSKTILSRAAVAVLFFALVPGLASASAPGSLSLATQQAAPHSRGGEVGTLRFGGTLGLDLASDWTGFALRPQLSYTVAELDRNLYFDVAGHFGLTLGGGPGYSGQIWEVVPAARLRYAVSPKVSLYGDLGFGFAAIHSSTDFGGYSDTSMGAVLRFPFGLRYAVSPTVDMVFEPAGFNVYFNSNGNSFHYSMLVGALFKA